MALAVEENGGEQRLGHPLNQAQIEPCVHDACAQSSLPIDARRLDPWKSQGDLRVL